MDDLDLGQTVRGFLAGQKVFGRYTLKSILGRGGMGVVWRAFDEQLERDVALKFLPELIIRDRAVLDDLKRETKRSLELTHKNIVRIYDFVQDAESACISMEYVDGDTLSNLRADKPRKIFEPDELREWVSQLCDALDYAHNYARVIHRDLKPANLMVNQRGDLKVSDFGIARSLSDSVSKLTMEHGKSGTLVYMSPQQLDGEHGNHLDDVYSIGATLYELLTSRPPFYSGNVDRQIREKMPPLMTQRRKELEIEGAPINETWEEVVRACLAKDPARRPQSVAEIARQLEVPSPKTRHATEPPPRSSKKTEIAAGLVVLCLIATAGWYFGIYRPGEERKAHLVPITTKSGGAEVPSGPAHSPGGPIGGAAGGVIVDTSPSGATIMLDGTETGKSPATFKGIRPGKYPVRILLEGYETIEKQVEVKEDQFTDLGTITLQRGKAALELTSVPTGAKVLQGGVLIGTTPIQRADLTPGEATFLVVLEGYLPRELKGVLDPKQTLKEQVALAQAAPTYAGSIRVRSESYSSTRPLLITLGPDLKSGTMTQSSKRGDFVVKFTGIWEGTELHAVTGNVVSQPAGIQWAPESFTLRFSDDGKTGSYECVADGKSYVAELSGQSAGTTVSAKTASVYKGTIRLEGNSSGSGTPLTISLAADHKSGTMTQTSKSGDTVVRFNGIWDGDILRAVTNEVISKPKNVQWKPESFTLRFAEDGKRGSYECNSEGRLYSAELSPP